MTTPGPSLALGTVQWGMAYGIANQSGQATAEDVAAMVAMARAAGVDTLDTARAYGSSEAVVGRALAAERAQWRVVTKVDPAVVGEGDTPEQVEVATRASLQESLHHLGGEGLDLVLLHRPEHRTAAEGAAWRTLRAAQRAGQIGHIGVSATCPETAEAAVIVPEVEVMQVATSLLDRRLVTRGFFERAQQAQVEVHVRSVFLLSLIHI